MATNTDPQLNMDEIRDLLSPYLDGEVTDTERAQVEHALRISPALAAEMESLQQTVNWVSQLPVAAAPRPFTLTEADLRGSSPESRSKQSRWFPLPAWAFGLAAAAAVMIFVLAAGGLFLSVSWSTGDLAPAEVAMQQESAAPAMKEAEMGATGGPEADREGIIADEPQDSVAVEQPLEESPAAEEVVEESVVEQESETLSQPAVAPSVESEKAAQEEQPALAVAPEELPEKPLAAEAIEQEERLEETDIDDAAEDTAMMTAPAAEAEGGQAATGEQREPAGTAQGAQEMELAPPAPLASPALESQAEAVQRAPLTATPETLFAATPAIDSTPTATKLSPVTPSPTPTQAPIMQRSFRSRGLSLALGALVVVIIAGVGLWMIRRRIRKT